jgi:hypothetical protein
MREGAGPFGRTGDADIREQFNGSGPGFAAAELVVAAQVSVIWSPTVFTGFRLVIGSWKIIAMSRPRMSSSSRWSRASRFRPPNRTSPEVVRALEWRSFDAIAAGADVLLATLLELARGDRP